MGGQFSQPGAGEVITSIPTEMALRQAEIAAMRALTSGVDDLRASVREMSADVKALREDMSEMRGARLQNQIDKLERRLETDIQRIDDDQRKQAVAQSRFQGLIAPIGAIATMFASGTIAWIFTHLH